MPRAEIGALTRDYVFLVLWPGMRQPEDHPLFAEDGEEGDTMRERVERLGMPRWRSAAFARRMAQRGLRRAER